MSRSMSRLRRARLAARKLGLGGLGFAAALLASGTASAHHVMDFEMPQTFFQGLLSGFGHPIIGPDHLAFILAIGLIGTLFARGYLLPLVFVGGTLAGCGIHLLSWDLPVVEPVVSATVVLAGTLLALYRSIDIRAFAAITAFAGLFHGYAYGESIVGAEPTPLLAYLVGFAVIQSLIALAAFGVGKLLLAKKATAAVGGLRVFGGLIAAAGVYFFASALIA